ncbi:hypothetical protein [Leucobacter sp. NPDC077196]|uniref:hypothetical protein n=1 Tax=Leucobacter sp. NPDC077196 TaxID=3154959 RepID=UPI00343C1CCF
MTETTEKSREELEAELESLRAQSSAPAIATRDRSPLKPSDHRPPIKQPRTVEFAGESYTFDVRAAKDANTMFALQRNDFETVLVRVIGADGLKRALESTADEDGFSDFEELAELTAALYKAADSKNS